MPDIRHFALSLGILVATLVPTQAQEAFPSTLPSLRNPATDPAVPQATSAQAESTNCSPVTCCPAEECVGCPGSPSRWWVSGDYTFGWIRGVSVPPLLTATPVGGGTPTVLFGNKTLNDGFRNGFQLRGGFWLDGCGECGIEAGMLFLGGLTSRIQVGDVPGTVIGRPFFNTMTNAPDSELVSAPGTLSGRGTASAGASDFWGANVAFRKLICCDCRGRLDFLVGYRFLSSGDSVGVTEDLQPIAAPFPPGSRIGVSDTFTASNQFHGALFALAGEYRLKSWYLQGTGGVSFGGTFRQATVSGSTSIQVPPAPTEVLPGGLLALSSNSGTFSGSDWVFVPEAAVRLGYQIRENLRIYAGYSFLYWPSIYRAADQINPVVNPALLPPPLPLTGPASPLFPDRKSSLCVQALSIGLEFRY
jgi:Putative beta barrel porin-7 (BBP7)